MSTARSGSEFKKGSYVDHKRSLIKNFFQEDIFDKILRISQNYHFVRNGPIPAISEDENHTDSSASELRYENPNIYCSFKKDKGKTGDMYLEKVTYKNQPLETNTLRVLNESLDGYCYLTTLKFEFCGLSADQLKLLDKMLVFYERIQEVSVNGNPIKEQNYYILLRHKLQSLSLKLCGINREGVKTICQELYSPHENTLLHLNLASNALFDDGMEPIANLLRMNRKLISLNLADNKIRNEGLITLLESLQKFELNHDEVIVRRLFKLDYQRKILSSPIANLDSRRSKVRNVPSKRASRASGISKIRTMSISQRFCADLSDNPILEESFEEDERIYCIGNNILINLNLAYNRITNKVVPNIKAMLEYQIEQLTNSLDTSKTGLSRLSLIGNDISEEFLEDIYMLLARKRSTSAIAMELYKVFVYGTLKVGEPNHSWFTKSTNGYYKFISKARTLEKFPLIIATKYNVPFILKSPGNGSHVEGEVYEIDDNVLRDLDVLEDHPNFYVREKVNVSFLNEEKSSVQVWIYVIKNFNPNLLNEPFYESYSNNGTHGKKYVERDESTIEELNDL